MNLVFFRFSFSLFNLADLSKEEEEEEEENLSSRRENNIKGPLSWLDEPHYMT